ncbi:MAG TPA: XdhC family protein [Pyrinomonadaceae bacterium]|nr:XdhC family protein [Pyrinomonadaceae bacterium]
MEGIERGGRQRLASKARIRLDIQDQFDDLRTREEPFVLATVVAYKSPQSAKPGSKAIIKADGSTSGWVGGGCVQPIVLREAKQALKTGKPKLLTISPDAERDDWDGAESFRMTCEGGGSLEIYLEPYLPKPQLLIVGRSPVAQTLSHLGRLLDFKVVVADAEARTEDFPDADQLLSDLDLIRDQINERTFVVVATMGNGDEEGLMSVIGTSPGYLGLVASEKKSKALFEYARGKGATDEDLAMIKCPAGLNFGSETWPEIALSIAAEIISVRRAAHEQSAEGHVAIDPICGMTVNVDNAKYTSVVNNETIYFCCLRCKESFDQTSDRISGFTQLTRFM